jgi:NADH:ubiquinone oxidoreductase subunit 4 (subunit M)
VTNAKNANLPDLNSREWATLLPLVFLALFMGVFSSVFTPSIEMPVTQIIRDARAKSIAVTGRRVADPALLQPRVGEGAQP